MSKGISLVFNLLLFEHCKLLNLQRDIFILLNIQVLLSIHLLLSSVWHWSTTKTYHPVHNVLQLIPCQPVKTSESFTCICRLYSPLTITFPLHGWINRSTQFTLKCAIRNITAELNLSFIRFHCAMLVYNITGVCNWQRVTLEAVKHLQHFVAGSYRQLFSFCSTYTDGYKIEFILQLYFCLFVDWCQPLHIM